MSAISTGRLRNIGRELRDLGPRGALYCVRRELKNRVGLFDSLPRASEPELPRSVSADQLDRLAWTARLPFTDPTSIADVMHDRISSESVAALKAVADQACRGRILCFGKWMADFGDPIDWHSDPLTRRAWDPRLPAAKALSRQSTDDVKFAWEIARFPHAYHMARAAALSPDCAPAFAFALTEHIATFIRANPYGMGIHWFSSQDVAIRLFAWLFALDALLLRSAHRERAADTIGRALALGGIYIEENIAYARLVVNNNHLICEALGLFTAGAMLPDLPQSSRWRRLGRDILDEEADRQVYRDGGYINQSHTYHRVVLQHYLWASALATSIGDRPSDVWLRAMRRSLDFLVAHQNPADGRLPNYGGNDGSMPSVLSTTDYSDFRPTLQATNVAVRGERLYDAGPWDEEATWFFGPRVLDLPLGRPDRKSVSFSFTGSHVLRGQKADTFCTFRCGTLRHRFSQIDMLHVDVWWRGVNVLVDGGSYSYSGPRLWHDHFMRTAVHNTVEIDGLDQMLHVRQFKVIYWTRAKVLRFEESSDWTICEGEHYGYQRHPGACVHRRAVLFIKNGIWVIADTVQGNGNHSVRLHWLAEDFPHSYDLGRGELRLATPGGAFGVRILDERAHPISVDVVRGREDPPRGWLSRYYGEKRPVPSLVVTRQHTLPVTLVSLLSGGTAEADVRNGVWRVDGDGVGAMFTLVDGRFADVKARVRP